jgi:hypothetical protein
MVKQLRMACVAGTLALAAMTALPAMAGTFPASADEFAPAFWTEARMRAMDSNKDGMVSRDEFLTYMGQQFDMMDTGKKKMLTRAQFMDRKMMALTFPASVGETSTR